ncbi:MAG: DUF1559 domain-containing protein, partial [Thermoguttaceae bacterium]|nr:DUF1559 domain-containing protein [Thermoguttaceae bacterium]
DGTSNTMAIGEQSGVVGPGYPLFASYEGAWAGLSQPAKFTDGDNFGALYGSGMTTVHWAPNAQGDSYNGPNGEKGTNAYHHNTLLSSCHSGGVNVLYGDGSVHFISDTIQIETLRSLCARNDGQTIAN